MFSVMSLGSFPHHPSLPRAFNFGGQGGFEHVERWERERGAVHGALGRAPGTGDVQLFIAAAAARRRDVVFTRGGGGKERAWWGRMRAVLEPEPRSARVAERRYGGRTDPALPPCPDSVRGGTGVR